MIFSLCNNTFRLKGNLCKLKLQLYVYDGGLKQEDNAKNLFERGMMKFLTRLHPIKVLDRMPYLSSNAMNFFLLLPQVLSVENENFHQCALSFAIVLSFMVKLRRFTRDVGVR